MDFKAYLASSSSEEESEEEEENDSKKENQDLKLARYKVMKVMILLIISHESEDIYHRCGTL